MYLSHRSNTNTNTTLLNVFLCVTFKSVLCEMFLHTIIACLVWVCNVCVVCVVFFFCVLLLTQENRAHVPVECYSWSSAATLFPGQVWAETARFRSTGRERYAIGNIIRGPRQTHKSRKSFAWKPRERERNSKPHLTQRENFPYARENRTIRRAKRSIRKFSVIQ